MRGSFKIKAIFVLAAVAIGIAFDFFAGNFFYSLFWAYLGEHGYKEADVIAYWPNSGPFVLI